MEVFMSNLPKDLTEKALRSQLEQHISSLDIQDLHWICEKPKDRVFGSVTFLRSSDGEKFVNRHGQIEIPTSGGGFRHFPPTNTKGRPRHRANLYLIGTPVYCRLSNSQTGFPDGTPNSITIRGMEHAITESKAREDDRDREEPAVVFQLFSSSCGYVVFNNGRLVYVSEVDFNIGKMSAATCKFTKKNVVVKFENKLIRIPVKTVVELDWDKNGALTLTLSAVPFIFETSNETDILSQKLALLLGANDNRQPPDKIRLCSLGKAHEGVIGQCLVYQFRVNPTDLDQKMRSLAKQKTMAVVRHHHVTGTTPLPGLGDFRAAMSLLRHRLGHCNQEDLLPFGILYQLQALAYNAYLHPTTVLGLLDALLKTAEADKAEGIPLSISVDSLKKMFEQIDWPRPNDDPSNFEVNSLLGLLRENENHIHDSSMFHQGLFSPTDGLARVHRVTVTPTRILFHGPELESRNRILRKFPNHHDYFIRVQFYDENGQDLQFSPTVDIEGIYTRFKQVLKYGIQIAGRTYKFLGFSHSSLRFHSVWFYAPFLDDSGNLQTYFTMISGLGNFDTIYSPARCAARIGQAFSETPFAVPLDKHGVLVTSIPDVKSPDGSRVFSDGVGKISMGLAELIWTYLPVKKSSPTCFQVRLGAVKGMLAVDARLDGLQVQIRPSMTKFQSTDMSVLGICDMASKPIQLVLNRQLIKILEDMGVGWEWFFKLQNMELVRLREITSSADNTANFLKYKNIGDSIMLFKFLGTCGNLDIDYRKDDFLRSVVEAVVLRDVRLLKHKARIPVKEGITLFGVMDETGYLNEGEVYISYDTMKGRYVDPPEHLASVLVTRSPALHPGDVQRAKNIVPPDDHPLWELSNCIAFSQKGTRDLPSQLSGGDLDGDLYNVIWDLEALPKTTFQAADYPRVEPLNIGRKVTDNDMAEFFVEFMKTDYLGVVANRHMIIADQHEMGTLSPHCLTLAQLHSTAVDFSKTGISVNLKTIPRPKTVKFRPDFLAPGPQSYLFEKADIELAELELPVNDVEDDDEGSGPRYAYYRSEKLLGHLYRAVDERKIWEEDVKAVTRSTRGSQSFWKEFLAFAESECERFGGAQWKTYSEEAERLKHAYEDAIMTVMDDFSDDLMNPITELEVFIGNILNKTGVQTHRQRDRSHKLRDEFERISTWITRQMRLLDIRDLDTSGQKGNGTDPLALCLACVHKGCEAGQFKTRRKDAYSGLSSFRVVAASTLLRVMRGLEKQEGGTGNRMRAG